MKRLAVIDYLVIIAIVLGGIIIAEGFLHPDPYYLQKGLVARVLLWGLRIGTVIATIVAACAYWAMRSGRLSGVALAIVGFSAFFALLIGYPVAQYAYEKSYTRQIEKYHPYLQLRPNDLPSDLPEERFLIMCLGGSTTEFADPEGGGWPGRLQKLLPQTVQGKPLVVVNAGRQWYTTQHSLINYLLNLRQAKPDVLIIMQSVNDMLTNADFSYISHGSFRGDYGHFYGPVNRIIDRKSLVPFFSDMVGGLWNHSPREVVTTTTFPGLKSFERNVRTLLEIAKLDGTRMVLMSEPYLFKEQMTPDEAAALVLTNYEGVGPSKRWSPATGKYGMDQYNGKMRQLAQEANVPFIDLDAAIPKDLKHFYDEVHYRAETFDIVASTVAEGLRKEGVVPS